MRDDEPAAREHEPDPGAPRPGQRSLTRPADLAPAQPYDARGGPVEPGRTLQQRRLFPELDGPVTAVRACRGIDTKVPTSLTCDVSMEEAR
jgi:hypothetical protein